MSSSDPPQLRLSLPQAASNFKRSFEQFGFDLESPLDSSAAASSSVTDEHRPGPSNTDRNKRARSSSVTLNSVEQAHVVDNSSSSSSSYAVSSGSSHHPVTNHSDAPPLAAATRYPQAPETVPAFPSALGGELSHSSSGLFDSPPPEASPIQPTTTSVWSNRSSSSTNSGTEQNDQFRTSMERFHAFDSQISSIRSRPSPLPPRAPLNASALPPLTLSSPNEHAHSHTSSAVSLPSVESLSYSSTPAQAPPSAPPPTAPPSATSPDQYHSDMSPLRFEEFGEFREMMGFFREQNPNSPSIDRPTLRRRHQSPPPDNSDRPRIPPFRRSTPRHMAENVSRNSTMHLWPPLRMGSHPDDSDDDFGGRLNMQGRGSLDHSRSRLDSSLLASRIRRSMDDQETPTPLSRMPPPLFSPMASSQAEPNSTHPVNSSRTQESGRANRHELWPFHSPRLPVFAEAVRTLLGRARQRTSYAGERRTGRSRSPGSGVFSSSVSPAHYDWSFDYPEFTSSEDSPYELDLPTPSRWLNEENAMPTSRVQRDASISRQVPWRSSLSSNEVTHSDPAWRRPSYTNHYAPHPSSIRTGSGRGDGANNTPLTRAPHAIGPDTTTTDVGPGWWRGVPPTELNYGLIHEHDMGSTSNSNAILSDGPPIDHPSISMRDFIWPQHPQPPSHIASHDLSSTRRPSEAYQYVQPPEVGGTMVIDADVFRPDESSEVPFSSHAAPLFTSRAPSSTLEPMSHRRLDGIGLDHVNEVSYDPLTGRFEDDFVLSASRRRAHAGQRRHRASPEPERSNTTRRPAATEPFTISTGPSRVLDIEEFDHGPFRATLERLERHVRQGRQDQQMMMERQAEMDRLRSRLDELQSQERLIPSSRAPSLPPLRLDPELFAPEFPYRRSSPTPPANIETPSSLRVDLEAERRRRSWQRPRATRPSLPHSSDSVVHPLPEGQNALPIPERERDRRRRPGTLELWSPVDAEDAIFSMSTSPGDSGFLTRSLARLRGEFQSTDGQQPRREPRGNPPWGMDPGRLASREPPADASRGPRPLVWTTHPPVPWEGEMRSEVHPAGSSTGPPADAPVRGRRRRINQSALPPQGRNVSEDERPVGARRASSTSRYGAARRAIREPVLDRVQRAMRGGPREGGFSGRYARRNTGDYMRDEDFDASYENLLSLAATIGDVRPRHTPDHIINSLPSATFKEWRNAESDQRCPICLDDYQEDDTVMRLSECPHWLHKDCLQQWLRAATTCPVCRQRVRFPQPTRRERGGRAGSQPGPSRAADRSTLDIAREIHEHVRMVLPDYNYAAAIIHPAVAVTRSQSGVERGIAPHQDGDVEMSLDWDIAGPI